SAEMLVNGAGATFPYPIYSKWFSEYAKIDPSVKFNYQSIGSGGGIKQITAGTVDFGASDKFLTDAELKAAPGKLIHIPTVMGAVVVTYNLPGVAKGLKLKSEDVADIFLGKITKWNDKRIADDNPGVKLPNDPIIVVHRSDGSGTTFIFTNYLSKVSDEWKSKVGEGTAVQWAGANSTGGKGNEGVSAFVQRLNGAIGYVEYAYAKQNKMSYAVMQNAAGNFVSPDDATFKAAAAGAEWKNGFYEILTNQKGKDAWPISGATFILVQKTQDKPAQGAEVLKFFEWAYKNGGKMAEDLDYVAMPDAVVKLAHSAWGNVKDASGKSVWAGK
ncbi:MAG TPA: phosphate ABC transporter substrate-binding protein PstS, partial [Rhodocyclaceae bacterium]